MLRHRTTVSLVCLRCSRPFTRAAHEARRSTARVFCGVACYEADRAPFIPNFWRKVDRALTCWLWTAGTFTDGYGQYRNTHAHRVAWELAAGSPIPDGMKVLHTCDIPLCVRNDEEGIYEINGNIRPRWGHLFLGTTADNAVDMMVKGRSLLGDRNPARLHPERVARGERVHRSKLTATDIPIIKADYAAGGISTYQLAERYGVSRHTIYMVLHNKSWRHIS